MKLHTISARGLVATIEHRGGAINHDTAFWLIRVAGSAERTLTLRYARKRARQIIKYIKEHS